MKLAELYFISLLILAKSCFSEFSSRFICVADFFEDSAVYKIDFFLFLFLSRLSA